MKFKTIHTRAGLIAMSRAEATGTPVRLVQMAVGDGAGGPISPEESATTLAREIFRTAINRVFQSPTTPQRFTAEMVIPATVGGFVLREVGVFDADGSLFAIGNLPDTYKPMASEGAFSDTVVRLEFMVTNASVVTLQIDPNVAVATQQWISNNVTAKLLIPGGTTGQVLRKKSNADGDTQWVDPTAANVTVDVVEEQQTLAASQTAVVLNSTTTRGLSLYVGGVRLRNNEWTANPGDRTRLTLAASYPAGSRLTAVQNEPAGSAPAPLERSNNLADLADKAVARANLDVFSRGEARQLSPAGQVAYFANGSAPAGWLKANGAAVSRLAYADLFAAIGGTFGGGDGFNTFNIPDLRGEFVRGWDDGRGVDQDRPLGGAQGAFTPSIPADGWETTGGPSNPSTAYPYGRLLTGSGQREINEQQESVRAAGRDMQLGGDIRPRNVSLLACIKY